MNRILLIGVAALALSDATVAADAAQKHVRHFYQAPVQQQWSGAGATVEEVIPNTPAASAGIRPGDIIVGINGRTVNGYSDIDSPVAASVGRPLTIDIYRGGKRLRLRAAPRLMLVRNPYGEVTQRGVLGVAHTDFRGIPCALEPDCE
ncbi:MAG: PDZ domain-containing protein [Tepidisphaeraceae bacterium]|jgi:S1-C subfamily serine protease